MIFRIYDSNNAQNTNQDGWAEMKPNITTQQILSITDPNGGQVKNEITSIPSPWGRLDLVRTAFRNIVASGIIGGTTLDHKIVSDTLDVAQIFFNINRFRQQGLVELLRWDRAKELQILENSPIIGHQELARAWSKYLIDDSVSFNFNKLSEFAVLRFIHPHTKERTVIGATSPITLFFPAAGDLSEVSNYIAFGTDRPFDGNYCPLSRREDKFVVWLYSMQYYYPSFARDFKDLFDYLTLCKPHLSQATQASINNLQHDTYTANHTGLAFTPGQPVQILNTLDVHVDSGNNTGAIAQRSDFVINSTKALGNTPPLVLPVTAGYGMLHYVIGKWNSDTHVDEVVNTPLAQRILPADGSQYPYLTIGDFMEDKLIRLDNAMNTQHYYPGELQGILSTQNGNERGYLLPLKPLFFEYFSVDDLIQKKMLNFTVHGTAVVVTLRIPIKGGDITYSRQYQEVVQGFGTNSMPHSIVDVPLEMGMVYTKVYTPLCYVLPKDKSHNVDIKSFSSNGWQQLKYKSTQEGLDNKIHTVAVEGEFDALQVSLDGCSAMIVPRPLPSLGAFNNIEYSVDLGTSNTCIAYRVGTDIPKLFAWDEHEMVALLTTFNRYQDGKAVLVSRLGLPCLGKGLHTLPLRTALRVDKANPTFEGALLRMTPNFDYQYQDMSAESSIDRTNIKWSSDTNDHSLKAYIYGLCAWLRKHSELRDAIASVKLNWLYPSSMSSAQQQLLNKIWSEALAVFFPKGVTVTKHNEAVAPYHHLSRAGGVTGRTVSIDMGGGTIDILITGNNVHEPMHLTSARFGANVLYSAPSNLQHSGSGFARMLCDYLSEQKENNEAISEDLSLTLRKMEDFISGSRAEEAVDSFFSLSKVLEAKNNKNLETDLSIILASEIKGRKRLRTLVLLYFTLQVWHVAELIHHRDLARPNNFVFSGNGSRIIKVLGDEELLGKLITYIFDFVALHYDKEKEGHSIKVLFNSKPKESTAYGAINDVAQSNTNLSTLILVSDNRLIDVSEQEAKFSSQDESLLYKDLDNFGTLFSSLNDKLRLVRDWEYDKDSLELVSTMIKDQHSNKTSFDAYVKLPQNGDTYSQSLLFSLMEHRIKEIGYELYN